MLSFKTNCKRRRRCPENWIDIKRKYLVNSGQQYISRNGKIRNKVELRPIFLTSCKFKCFEKFNTVTRQNIFNNFWALADHTRTFINKFTKKINKRRITTEGPSRRPFTTKYFFSIHADNTYTPQLVWKHL